MSMRYIVSSLLVGMMALSFAGCQNNKAAMCDPSCCDKKECRDAGKCMDKCGKACADKCDSKAAKCNPATCDKKECRDAGKCMGKCEKACADKCDNKAAMSGPAAAETKNVAAVTPAAAGATCINTVCPIGGHKIGSDAVKVNYKGKTIGMCCPDCVDEMNKMSEAQRDEVLAKASKK